MHRFLGRESLTLFGAIAIAANLLFAAAGMVVPQNAYAADYVISDEGSCLALPSGSPSWDETTHSCEINGSLTISSDDGIDIFSETKLVVKPSGEINNSGLIRNNESLITNYGVIINYGIIEQIFLGELDNYGSLTNEGTIRNLQAPPSINNYGSLTNTGTLFQGALTNDASGSIINSGVIASWSLFNNYGTITSDGTIDSTQNPDSPFNNYGTISSMGTFRNEATFNNHGIITNDGELINQGLHTGTITNHLEGTIENKNIFTNFGSVKNSGTITNHPNGLIDNFFVYSKIENDGTVINYGAVTSSGHIINSASGNLESYGTIELKDGDLTNSGEITVANTGNDSIGITNSASIFNSGTISVANTGIPSIGIKNLEGASISNSGTIASDCGGIIINEGTFTGNPILDICDTDGDGIADNVDTQPANSSDQFSDTGIGGTTTGSITARGGQLVTVVEAPNPDGVRIKTDSAGTGNSAKISACAETAKYSLSAGKEIVVTCHSVETEVIQGPVHADLFGTNGFTASIDIPAGFAFTFDQATNSITADAGNPGPLTFTTGGNTVTVDPGETIQLLAVTIDIKPDGTPNTINVKSDKTVTVALLGSSTFNVNTVDKSTLRFGPTLQPAIKTFLQDVNKDSFMDMVSQYKVPPLGFKTTDTLGSLTGLLLQSGIPFMGSDSVRILNK